MLAIFGCSIRVGSYVLLEPNGSRDQARTNNVNAFRSNSFLLYFATNLVMTPVSC